ncbi:MAG: hypothetical protein B7Z37_19260 [Verrucomicrobia bacterium 12-59-8]|nr:MAG: hypothetical protein B7Z37_19260 [Verrucomicrobia bacterium 12-59-8]
MNCHSACDIFFTPRKCTDETDETGFVGFVGVHLELFRRNPAEQRLAFRRNEGPGWHKWRWLAS